MSNPPTKPIGKHFRMPFLTKNNEEPQVTESSTDLYLRTNNKSNALEAETMFTESDPDENETLRNALAESIQQHAVAIQTGNTRLESVEEAEEKTTEADDVVPPKRTQTSTRHETGTMVGSIVDSVRRGSATVSRRIVGTRNGTGAERPRGEGFTGVLKTKSITTFRSLWTSSQSLDPDKSRSVKSSDVRINVPTMPYETRNAMCIRVFVSLLCFSVSLIVTILFQNGTGLQTASFMYNIFIDDEHNFEEKSYHSLAGNAASSQSVPVQAPLNSIGIPDAMMNNMANVSDPINVNSESLDQPVFWYIPKSGARVLGFVIHRCLDFVEASNLGGSLPEQDNDIRIYKDNTSGIRFVNIDTTNIDGLHRAKDIGFAASQLADITITPLVQDIPLVFDQTYRGRFFTILRHPIDRSWSLFLDAKANNPEFSDKSFVDFAQMEQLPDNFVTRSLVNKPVGNLIEDDLYLAQLILQEKFIIGLYMQLQESVDRFEKYFGWDKKINYSVDGCQKLNFNPTPKSPEVEEGTIGWDLIMRQNEYDVQLYLYAEELFRRQESIIHFL